MEDKEKMRKMVLNWREEKNEEDGGKMRGKRMKGKLG